jgi:hypothetical protein
VDYPSDTAILDRLCRGRGLVFDRINPEEDLLLPPAGSASDLDQYRSLLDHYAVRLLLKEIIKSQDMGAWVKGRRSVERFCNTDAVDSFLQRLLNLGIIEKTAEGLPRPCTPVRSFGPTYEWYVAKVLTTDFVSPSAWGVRFSEMGSGGDHDVISSVSGRFLYLEAKTAPPKHIEPPEVSGFARRLFDIAPDIAIFHNDTHLRMKDKIVPMMENAIIQSRVQSLEPALSKRKRVEGSRGKDPFNVQRSTLNVNPPCFERLEREIFHMSSCIYIVNSKPDLKRNLNTVLRHYFRSQSGVIGNCLTFNV